MRRRCSQSPPNPYRIHQSKTNSLLQVELQDRLEVTWRKDNLTSQASDLLIVLVIDSSSDRVLSWRDRLWQINLLLQQQVSWGDWALEADFVNVFAEVEVLVDELDVAVLDGELNVGALEDGLLDGSGGGDGKSLARKWWIWNEVDLLNLDQVLRWIAAELERVLAWNL